MGVGVIPVTTTLRIEERGGGGRDGEEERCRTSWKRHVVLSLCQQCLAIATRFGLACTSTNVAEVASRPTYITSDLRYLKPAHRTSSHFTSWDNSSLVLTLYIPFILVLKLLGSIASMVYKFYKSFTVVLTH